MKEPSAWSPEEAEWEICPFSFLNDCLHCQRRAALKIVEGWGGTDVHGE